MSRLSPQPVAFYAAVFFLVNATYIGPILELVAEDIAPQVQKTMRIRAIVTLALFAIAAIVALKYPLAGLGICICCLIVYLRPDPPQAEIPASRP